MVKCKAVRILFCNFAPVKNYKNGTSIQLHYQSGSVGDDADPVYDYRPVHRPEVRKEPEVRTLRGCRFRGSGHRDGPLDEQLRRSAE